MEERIHRRQELQDPTAVPAEAAPPGDDAAPAPVVPSGDETDNVHSDGESEFEFPFVSRDSPALADDLFADGRIRPFYPVFGRGGGGTGTDDPAPAAARKRGQLGRLFLEESRERNSSTGSTTSSTSSCAATDGDDGGLDGAAPDSYCVWAPGSSGPPRPPRKSGSTGSMARWRRISELVVGRSHSDGKEKFLFLPATPPPPKQRDREGDKPKPKPKPNPAGGGKKSSPTELNTLTAAHRVAYGATKGGGGVPPRRTFLPYREELVGFFANVNGISRSHPHPY